MSVSCEPIRDRSGRRQAVAPLLTEAARRSINTTGFASGERKSARKKNGHFSAGQSAGNLSLHGGKPARAACKRRETDKTAPILHRVLPDKASPHKEAINEKQKIMEKKQSTALEKADADTATLTLSILFVVSILCTILFSLTA